MNSGLLKILADQIFYFDNVLINVKLTRVLLLVNECAELMGIFLHSVSLPVKTKSERN